MRRRPAPRRAILPGVSSWLPAIVSGAVFLVALRRLPLNHPVQLWSGSWTVATALYAIRLFPYRDLSWLTAALICGAVVLFAAGVWIGVRLAGQRREPRGQPEDANVVRFAALLALPLLGLTLLAFFAQLVSRYGISRVIRISPEVKLYLSSGEAPLSGTYVDFALVATVLCALTGVRAATPKARRRWLVGAALCSATIYFSTSRAFIAVALVAALAVVAVAGVKIDRRRLAILAVAAVVVISLSFVALGSLLGKTYGNSGIGQFDNFFSRHPPVSWLALPYEDVTASIPALDLQVGAATTWGRGYGCASFPTVCGVVRKLGVDVVRVPVTGAFTKRPLQWNAYTVLDRLLIDGGTALTLMFVAIIGTLVGYLWRRARAGSTIAILVYAMATPALLAAVRNSLFVLVVHSAAIAAVLLGIARVLSPRAERLWPALTRALGFAPGVSAGPREA
jgi:oligosaccharide repeat unit polymerase